MHLQAGPFPGQTFAGAQVELPLVPGTGQNVAADAAIAQIGSHVRAGRVRGEQLTRQIEECHTAASSPEALGQTRGKVPGLPDQVPAQGELSRTSALVAANDID